MKKSKIPSNRTTPPAKSKRGGARLGAGRKPTIAGERISAMLESEQVEWLKAQPGGISIALRAAVTAAMDAQAAITYARPSTVPKQ